MHHPRASSIDITTRTINPILPYKLDKHPTRDYLLLVVHHPAVHGSPGNSRRQLHLLRLENAVDQNGGVRQGSQQVPSHLHRAQIALTERHPQEIKRQSDWNHREDRGQKKRAEG